MELAAARRTSWCHPGSAPRKALSMGHGMAHGLWLMAFGFGFMISEGAP